MLLPRPTRRCLLLVAASVPLTALTALAGNAAADAPSLSVTCPDQDLQTAIDNAPTGATINVAGTCIGSFTIVKNLTLQQPATAVPGPVSVLDGNYAGTVLTISDRLNFHPTVRLIRLRIQHGSGSFSQGGGIVNEGTLTLDHVVVTGNLNVYDAGIENNGTSGRNVSLTLINSTVTGNTALNSTAGIANVGIFGNASLTLINSRVSGNTAGIPGNPYPGNNVGGGIGNFSFQGNASVTLIHSTVSGNTAGYAGGGIYNYSNASLTLTDHSHVTGNTAKSPAPAGGGIALCNGNYTSDGTSDVLGNTPDDVASVC